MKIPQFILDQCNASLQANITTLTTERDAARGDLAKATAKGDELGTQLAAEKTAHDATKAALKTAQEADAAEKTAHTATKAELAKAKGQQTTTEAAAAAVTASQGIPAGTLPKEPVAPTQTKTMTRAAFNQLSPGQAAQFCKAGGRLTD